MTWLARLIEAIHKAYPRVIIEPQVDASVVLRNRLLADKLDLVVAPDLIADPRFKSKPVGTAEHAWMCKPGHLGRRKRMRLDELARHRLLVQDTRSGTGQLYDRWMRNLGIEATDTLVSNSVVALIGLTVSGMGVSYLPRQCLNQMVKAGALEVLSVQPALPKTVYAVMCKGDRPSTLIAEVMTMAQESCDVRTMFQTR